NIKQRIKTAIELRLTVHPEKYGLPLRNTLKGYWKIRVGDYRVVYQIKEKAIVVKAIMHRKDIYKEVFSRL
ncbi:MAG: addiction module antitoxin RelB, partial [Candidatus Firestonebacteria bacterium RIFOXYA2_FULL_40_8]